MAKRHNHYRGRGDSRGGHRHQGSSRGRGGGKFFKGKGRHQSNWLKKVSALGNGDLRNPDMDDVFFGDHIDPSGVEEYYFGRHKDKSMSMGGFRPGQREDKPGSKLAFRKRPMTFVKAEDIYDPSHDIIEALRRENSHLIKPDVQEEDDGKNVDKNERDEEEQHKEEQKEEKAKGDQDEDMDKQEESDVTAVKDEDLYVMDNEGENDTEIKSVHVEETDNTVDNTEYDPTITIGKVQLSVGQEHPEKLVDNHRIGSPQLSGTMGDLKICENAPLPPKQFQDAQPSQNTQRTQDPPATQELPFGMAQEDSLVDLSDISITNVRVGFADDSYYVTCFRMFGDHEPKWVDKGNLSDFILEELNFPEHRLEAYLQFVKESIIKPDEPEPTYSDISLSASDSEEYENEGLFREDESVSSDMKEGLEDLIAYTEKYNVGRNMEYETSTLNSVGKGKKKRLLIDESLGLDSATISTLEDKFKNRVETKANKRRTKQDFIDETNQFSEDLFKKYPIGLHIQNIKDECELFLLKDRDRLSFPPLDPHGNNVILKMSHHFNLKGYREGAGKGTYVIVQKTRGTERYSPDYNRVHQLLRQRPVFYRVDVNRPGKTNTERVKTKAKFHAKEGEVVGQDAPVIGSDNIGRKMLEKLGWSSGEGLGARGNKGIAEPLMARVKKSKSGLKQSQDQQ